MDIKTTSRELPFDQETAKETAAVAVPRWARSVLVFFPELNSGSTGLYQSLDEGETFGKRSFNLDGGVNPRTSYTGGSATVDDILWFDVAGMTHIKLVSSVAQTDKAARMVFKG